MTIDLATVWTTVGVVLDLTGAIALASAALWLWPRRARLGTAGSAVAGALMLTACWCLSAAASLVGTSPGFTTSIAESARNLAWLLVIYRLFNGDGRDAAPVPIRPVVVALAFVEILHLSVDYGLSRAELESAMLRIAFDFNALVRLLVTIGALVLLHNLYGGAPREARPALRWPATGLAVLCAFDLNLYTVAYLSGSMPVEITAFRGLVAVGLVVCVGIWASGNREDLRLRPSRAVTFQTFSLIVIGAYLVAMVAVAQWLSYAGGDFARLIELGFLTLASAVALVVLPSSKMRGWLRVMLVKHLFQHRYDYREEWLRFARTMGNAGEEALPLGERAVHSFADVFQSPAGLLLTPGEQGELTLTARWNWPDIEVPGVAFPLGALEPFERIGYIADLDELREGRSSAARNVEVPAWLIDDARAWALIPLVHYERLVGMVVLARPQIARRFDWEDYDLLRVIGQQVASYLAENASQEALAESSRFEDFHRRIAFVMHDIKNLASQFSLLARNAELHADKPAFRADMLVTLRSSSDKLNALLARLSRYGNGGVDRLEQISTAEVIASLMERFRDRPQVVLVESHDFVVTANRHSLEQVLVHLVQNALDASKADGLVFVSLVANGLNARFDVVDSGCGMSPEFVRNGLFKPFVSTKSGGFGIGAFEARELVRAMRGRLDVESRVGLGSRFVVRVPLALSADAPPLNSDREVA